MREPLRRCIFMSCFMLSVVSTDEACAQFVDHTLTSGITLNSNVAMWGCGMSAFDFNDDGFDDLTIAENLSGIALYQSEGDGSFTLVDYVTLNAVIKQVMWVDFDNDHDADLFATTNGNGFFLYERTDDGALVLRSDLFSQYAQFDAQGASWCDYDKDGWKDLFVCYYLYGQASEYPNLLFHNEQGVFNEVGEQLGVASWANQGFQGVWTDFDRDGWTDLYVINDHEVGNEYYRNVEGASFENLSATNGSGVQLASMSNSVADFDRDGDYDVFISNGGNQVLLENTNGMFENVAPDLGLDVFTFGWAGIWIDHDNNGWQDLYLCNTNGYANGDNNFFWVNESGEAFSELPFDPHTMSSYVAVTGDFNNDRFPDMAVYNGSPAVVSVWINNAQSGHHAVKVNLQGVVSDYIGVGAEVTASIDGSVSMHQVLAGENYLAQNASSIIIGCGDATLIDSLVVAWPSGWKDVFYNVPVDAQYDVTEGETFIVSIASSNDFAMCPGGQCNVNVQISDAAFQGSIAWSSGNDGYSVQLADTGSYSVTVTNSFGIQRMFEFTIQHHQEAIVQTTVIAPLCNGQSSGQCIVLSDDLQSVDGAMFESQLTLSNLSAGMHAFTMIDVHGCESILEVLVPETPPMSLAQQSYITCANAVDWPSIEIQGAEPPVNITWEDEGQTPGAGAHVIEVIDHNGCEADFSLFIEHFPAAQVLVNDDTVCAGSATFCDWQSIGQVEIAWAEVVDATQGELTAGNYELHTIDEFGCSAYHDFAVYEFSPLQIFFSLDEIANQLHAQVTGGVEPYALQWSSGEITTDIMIGDESEYEVYVTDAAGCTAQADTVIILSHIDESVITWDFFASSFSRMFYFESPLSGNLIVYDMQGRIVWTGSVQQGRQRLDTMSWPVGRYVGRIMASGE